jgi:asparagine synthase (glutamine-hydrolysing)
MCGIYGFIGSINIDLQKRKLSLINYRGPDNCECYFDENVFLGHNRLSIIDLDARSNQPFCYEHLIIVFNGEIYNFHDIKTDLKSKFYNFKTESDTEVICAAYLEYGFDCVNKFNGMFSFVIFDKKKNIFFGARDRLGKKPFFYKLGIDNFEFSSQLSPLTYKSHNIIDWNNVQEYFFWGYNQTVNTPFSNIKKLSPGSYFIYNLSNKVFNEKVYWNLDLEKSETSNLNYIESVEYLNDLIINAVKIRKLVDVPLGVFLSGGIDSSLITAIAKSTTNSTVKTFSISFQEDSYDESKYANSIAKYLNTEHNTFVCGKDESLEFITNIQDYIDEPLSDPSYIPTLLLSKKTAQNVTVALSGDGGDEIFLGYDRYKWINNIKYLYQIPLPLRKLLFGLFSYSRNYRHKLIAIGLTQEGLFDLYCKMVGNIKNNWLDFSYSYKSEDVNWKSELNLINSLGYFDIKTYLNGDINTKVDRASMRFSLETRAPLMDYRILEFANTLPQDFKFSKKSQKLLLKSVLDLYIPKQYFNRPKAGFAMPLKEWFRTDLKDFVYDTLHRDALKTIPFLNVNHFEKMISNHMKGNENNSLEIWKTIVWLKYYENI